MAQKTRFVTHAGICVRRGDIETVLLGLNSPMWKLARFARSFQKPEPNFLTFFRLRQQGFNVENLFFDPAGLLSIVHGSINQTNVEIMEKAYNQIARSCR